MYSIVELSMLKSSRFRNSRNMFFLPDLSNNLKNSYFSRLGVTLTFSLKRKNELFAFFPSLKKMLVVLEKT